MGKTRPPYPREYREEAVRLVRESGKSIGQIAKDLGIADQSLRNWVVQADLDSGRRADGLTTEEREELRRLRRENRILRASRECGVAASGSPGSCARRSWWGRTDVADHAPRSGTPGPRWRRIWCAGSSRRRSPISSGSRTSRMCGRAAAGCTWNRRPTAGVVHFGPRDPIHEPGLRAAML